MFLLSNIYSALWFALARVSVRRRVSVASPGPSQPCFRHAPCSCRRLGSSKGFRGQGSPRFQWQTVQPYLAGWRWSSTMSASIALGNRVVRVARGSAFGCLMGRVVSSSKCGTAEDEIRPVEFKPANKMFTPVPGHGIPNPYSRKARGAIAVANPLDAFGALTEELELTT